MASMNVRDMEAMLGDILAEGEEYSCCLWSLFACNSKTRIILSQVSDLPDSKPNMMPLNNTYAYVGLTDYHLNLVVVNAYKTNQIMDRFSIPLTKITRVEAKNGFIIGKSVLINVGEAKFQLDISSFASEHRDEQQQAARSMLIRKLVELNRR